jgi:hypothetical protein
MSDQDPGPNPYRALIGLITVVILIVVVVFITYRLRQAGDIQDCVMSGRTNCAPIETLRR